MKHFKKVLLLLVTVMLGVCCFGLAACGEKAPEAVDVNSIQFDGLSFTWNEVENATAYIVECGDKSATVHGLNFGVTIGDDVQLVTIKITAKNGAGESEQVVKDFTRIPTVSSASFDFDKDGTLSWTGVTGATGYVININGEEIVCGNVTSFSQFKAGKDNVIKVRATGADGTFSTYSGSVSRYYLDKPTKVDYDGEKITWVGDKKASGYIVYIDNKAQGESSDEYTTTTNEYAYKLKNGKSLKIEVQSIGDGTNVFSSAYSDEITCIQLDYVEDINVNDGVLTWTKVEGADYYEIELNKGITVTANDCSYDKLSVGDSYSIKIKAVSNDTKCFSYYGTQAKSVKILAAPEFDWDSNLALDGEKQIALSWSDIKEAGSYQVKIEKPNSSNPEIVTATPENKTLNYDYLETGEYKVSVKTIAKNNGEYDSKYSEPFTIIRLAAPKFKGIESTANNYNDGFKVKLEPADRSDYYVIYKNRTDALPLNNSNEYEVSKDNILSDDQAKSGATVTYTVRSFANAYVKGSKTVKLASLSGYATSFDVKIEPTPTNVKIDEGSITLKWDSLGNVAGYCIKEDNNKPGVILGQSSYDLNIDVGEKDLYVCTAGNGAEILASPFSTKVAVRKLAAPTGISIKTSIDNGKLTFNQVDGASSYTIYFDDKTDGIDSNNMDDIKNYLNKNGENGVSVSMKAVANYYSKEESRYIITSELNEFPFKFYKIAKVKNGSASIDGVYLKWGAPTNVNVSFTYDVYKDNAFYMNVKTPMIDLSGLEGKFDSYSFTIVCIGNDTDHTFDSDKSDEITLTKLETPTLNVSKTLDGYTWNAVSNVKEYQFIVGSEVISTIKKDASKDYYSIKTSVFMSEINVIKNGVVNISVVAVGDADGDKLYMNSNAAIINQTVAQLGKPDSLKLSYDKEQVSLSDGKIKATIEKPDANANGYTFTFSGINNLNDQYSENGNSHYYQAKATGTYNVIAVANGGMFDSDGVLYSNSPQSSQKTITLLSKQSESEIKCSDEHVISWEVLAYNGGYLLKIKYDNVNSEYSEPKPCPSPSFQAERNRTVYSVMVCTKGDGSMSVTSEWTEVVLNVKPSK